MRFPAQPLSSRILSRLAEAEAHELNPWLRDDLRIARLTVAYAASDEAVLCSPHVLASYRVLGLHPEKVWPAIQARRLALGPLCAAPPKKPPQSVKLWFEKANAARATNSRRGEAIDSLPISTPSMATVSIAALYPNSEAPSSAKKRDCTYDDLLLIVRKSHAPSSVVAATVAALTARGRWPEQDGPVSRILCVALEGMMLGGGDGDRNVVRSTARWRARRAVQLGYWRLVRKPNSWSDCPKCGAERRKHKIDCKCGECPLHARKCEKCGYEGRAKKPDGKANFDEFCRPYMYEINIEKFLFAPPAKGIRHFNHRSYQEHKAAAERGEHPNVTEMPRKPAQPTPQEPPPAKSAPARPAATSSEREPLAITRDVRMAIAGCYTNARKDGKDEEAAVKEVSESLSSERYYLAPSEIKLQLKIWQSKHGSLEPPVRRALEGALTCSSCQSVLVQNRGPGPRLICPKCSS
jgi:hypothetical protein